MQMIVATLLTAVTSAIVILIHFEIMTLMSKLANRVRWPVRIGLLVGVFTLFLAHSIEVWVFAGALYVGQEILQLGTLDGAFDGSARDYLYISLVNYTTLGYGVVGGVYCVQADRPVEGGAGLACPSRRSCRRFKRSWWSRGGSNSRPLHCERSALPAELRPHGADPGGSGGRIMCRKRGPVKQSETI